jgi:uncharacterized protein (TIGR02246 family)
MKSFAVFLLSLVLAAPHAVAQNRHIDEKTIRDIDATWSDGLEARDLNAVASVYADDAVFLAPGQPIVRGKAAIREWFRARFARRGYHASFSPTNITVAACGDIAYEVGTFRAQVLREDGATLVSLGKHLVAWEKRNGKWLVTAESINTDSTEPSVSEH